jgi:hypothetical protein
MKETYSVNNLILCFQSLLQKFETEAWQDLASVYGKLGSWSDAETCLEKARSMCYYSPRGWNETGMEKRLQS